MMTKRTLDELLDEINDDPEYIEWNRRDDVETMMHMDEEVSSPRHFNDLVTEIVGHRQYWSV